MRLVITMMTQTEISDQEVSKINQLLLDQFKSETKTFRFENDNFCEVDIDLMDVTFTEEGIYQDVQDVITVAEQVITEIRSDIDFIIANDDTAGLVANYDANPDDISKIGFFISKRKFPNLEPHYVSDNVYAYLNFEYVSFDCIFKIDWLLGKDKLLDKAIHELEDSNKNYSDGKEVYISPSEIVYLLPHISIFEEVLNMQITPFMIDTSTGELYELHDYAAATEATEDETNAVFYQKENELPEEITANLLPKLYVNNSDYESFRAYWENYFSSMATMKFSDDEKAQEMLTQGADLFYQIR